MRVTYRGERKDIFTGLYCDKDDWNSASQKVFSSDIDTSGLNKNLDLILRKAHQCFEELKFSGITFSMDELINKIKDKKQTPILLLEYIERCNEKIKRRVNVDITKATFIKYKTCLKHMQAFLEQEYKTRKFSLHSMDGKFLEKLFYYLRTDKNVAHNTAVKYLKHLGALIYTAVKDGIIKRDPFAEFKMKLKPVHRDFLTQDEINQLRETNLNSIDLERVHDIFLFACYTGLAYSDLKQLKGIHIIQDSDQSWYIRKPRQKTGQESIIPLLPAAIRILQKYSLTNDIRNVGWYVSANQKMNQRLKTIGALAGLEKTLHIFPGAFVTGNNIHPFGLEQQEDLEMVIALPQIARNFINVFDSHVQIPRVRLRLPEFEFDIAIPDNILERISIDEIQNTGVVQTAF